MFDFIVSKMKLYGTSKIISKHQELTYRELISLSLKNGKLLKETIPYKIKCAILCDDEIYSSIAVLAAWHAGYTVIPMSKNYGKENCISIINTISPDLIISDDVLPFDIDIQITAYNIKTCKFDRINESYNIESELYDVPLIMSTSGTTGLPKGVMLTRNGIISNLLAINKYFGLTSEDRIIISRPLFHCAVMTGEFLISLYNGTNIFFCSQTYNPQLIIKTASSENVTVACGTPTMFRHIAILNSRYKLPLNINKIILSGECLHNNYAETIKKAFPNAIIRNVYGLTEAGPRVSCSAISDFNMVPESVGTALDGIEIKIIDENFNELPSYQNGLVVIYTPAVMKGYYKSPQETKQSFINDIWLNTKDIGYKDSKGRLYITGRMDDLIIKGGMNIYPREIEIPILTLKEIKECIAYGIKSDGTSIGVDIVLNEEFAHLSLKEIQKLFTYVLPDYKIPNHVNIVTSLPTTASGKTLKIPYR